MITPDILAILGAPKEGFEWVEEDFSLRNASCLKLGDKAIDARGVHWVVAGDKETQTLVRGIAYGTGKFYRQVAVEPEPEPIWSFTQPCLWHMRAFADGRVEKNTDPSTKGSPTNKWLPLLESSAQDEALGAFIASLYARNKANEEKLREIRALAHGTNLDYHRQVRNERTAKLIEVCREIEL